MSHKVSLRNGQLEAHKQNLQTKMIVISPVQIIIKTNLVFTILI